MVVVTADMAGSIWKIVAKEGDAVDVGDELVVLESMKMEIPIVASVPGTVSAILVQIGQSIGQHEPIAHIDQF